MISLAVRIARRAREVARKLARRATGDAAPVGTDAATIDLAHPAIAADPYPHYEILRKNGPVQYLARHEFWIVLGYAEVEMAFSQPHVFSNAPYDDVDRVLLGADPPRHQSVRRLVTHLFTAEILGRLASFARDTAVRLVRERLDVVNDYAAVLSRAVAAELIGFDELTVREIIDAYEASLRVPHGFSMWTAALDRVAERSRTYGALLEAGPDSLSADEARSLVRLLWLAATMTTERTITRCVLRLLQHSDIRQQLESDLALVPPFIEEVLRLHPPEHMVPRVTTSPTRLGDTEIPAGASVRLCVSAANRDPSRFDDPAAFRIDRTNQRHFAFGSGIHRCIGAPLARSVVEVAVRTLLESMPGFRAEQPLTNLRYFMTPTALTPLELRIAR